MKFYKGFRKDTGQVLGDVANTNVIEEIAKLDNSSVCECASDAIEIEGYTVKKHGTSDFISVRHILESVKIEDTENAAYREKRELKALMRVRGTTLAKVKKVLNCLIRGNRIDAKYYSTELDFISDNHDAKGNWFNILDA